MITGRRTAAMLLASLAIIVVASACSSGGESAPAPPAVATTGTPESSSGECTMQSPTAVPAGQEFEVSWEGAETGDYIVVIPVGTTAIGDEPYTNVTMGSPLKVMAPSDPGEYELACLEGDTTDSFKARQPITVE